MSKEYDWQIPQVLATAVYLNSNGDAVIRQQSALMEDDNVVIIPQIFLTKLINALVDCKDE